MMSGWQALPVAGRLLESARWLEPQRCFQWVDILTAGIFRWVPGSELVHSIGLGFEFLSLATPSLTDDVQILASRETLYRYRWDRDPEPFAELPVGPDARLNDGIVDVDGRIWVGSMGIHPDLNDPRGKLWRVDPDGGVTEMLGGLGISNGIAWAGESSGFHVDSLRRALYALDTDGHGGLRHEILLEFPEPTEPDGIVLAEDVLWIALWEGGAVGRLDPASGDYAEVTVPAVRPTSVAISDELMLVTTAGQGTGSDLDASGQVLIQPIASLVFADGRRLTQEAMAT
jgi:sugar lactone lactonase YvrE